MIFLESLAKPLPWLKWHFALFHIRVLLTFLLHDQHLTRVHLLSDCRGVLNQIEKDLGITCWWKYLCTAICTLLFSAFDHSMMAGDGACGSGQTPEREHQVPFQLHLHKVLCGMGLGDLWPYNCRKNSLKD